MTALAKSEHDISLVVISGESGCSILTVLEGVVLWQVQKIGILHAQQIIHLKNSKLTGKSTDSL